jgi:glycosyltransferase involved in cell wall biosynthesis
MLFRDKAILVISPQPWEHIAISKHHYALELARRGNRVFFLEPPDASLSEAVRLRTAPESAAVTVVSYRPCFPFVLRFHARPVFDRLMRWQISRLLRAIGEPLDVVWCFDFNLFSDLRAFGAPVKIYHPVDPVQSPHQVRPAASADLVLGVSEEILSRFEGLGVPIACLGHGLASDFVDAYDNARHEHRAGNHGPGPHVGYFGRLTRPPLNRALLREMIARSPAATFHFWGPYTMTAEAAASFPDIAEFIEFLKEHPRVRLHGTRTPAELAREIQHMDAFVLTYALHPTESDRSNSHKILEYLSTGKAVVASRFSAYDDHPDILTMPEDDDDRRVPELLRETLDNLGECNAPERCEQRRRFALAHTYARHLERIEALLDRTTAQ